MRTRSYILWFSFKFWINIDSGILTRFGQIPKPTLILVLIQLEIEPPILESHIPLIEKEHEFNSLIWNQLLNLNFKSYSRVSIGSRTFHSWARVNHFIVSHFLLAIRIDHNDSVMIFQDWSYNQNKFNFRILHDPIHVGDCKYVNQKRS